MAESIKRMYMSCSCRKPATIVNHRRVCDIVSLMCIQCNTVALIRSSVNWTTNSQTDNDRQRSKGLILESQTERSVSSAWVFETLVYRPVSSRFSMQVRFTPPRYTQTKYAITAGWKCRTKVKLEVCNTWPPDINILRTKINSQTQRIVLHGAPACNSDIYTSRMKWQKKVECGSQTVRGKW